MQSNTMRKDCRSCHCGTCRSMSRRNNNSYKRAVYRWSNRRVRHSQNNQLKSLSDWDAFDRILVGGIYIA